MRSEPATLGPLPRGAQNQCRGRGASFIFLAAIDSHLPPSIRWSLERRGKTCTYTSASQEQEFTSNYFTWCLAVCQLHTFPPCHPRHIWSSTPGEPTGWTLHSWRPENSRWKRVLCVTWSSPLHLRHSLSLLPFNSSIELASPSILPSVLQG